MTTCYIQLPSDFDEKYMTYKKQLEAVAMSKQVRQSEVTTSQTQKITFDPKTGNITLGNEACSIPIDSNQFQLCKMLFALPYGEWLDETDVVGNFYKEGQRSFYDAIRLVNQKTEEDLKIKKMLVYDASRVKIRTDGF